MPLLCIQRIDRAYEDNVGLCFVDDWPESWCFLEILTCVRISAVLTVLLVPIGSIILWPSIQTTAIILCISLLMICFFVFFGVKFLRSALLLPFFAVTTVGIFFSFIGFVFNLPEKTRPQRAPSKEEALYCATSVWFLAFFISSHIICRRAMAILHRMRRTRDYNAAFPRRLEQTRQWLHAIKIDKQFPNPRLEHLRTIEITQGQVEDAEHCAICLEDWIVGERVVQLGCGHLYHSPCIRDTLANKANCPYCRRKIELTAVISEV